MCSDGGSRLPRSRHPGQSTTYAMSSASPAAGRIRYPAYRPSWRGGCTSSAEGNLTAGFSADEDSSPRSKAAAASRGCEIADVPDKSADEQWVWPNRVNANAISAMNSVDAMLAPTSTACCRPSSLPIRSDKPSSDLSGPEMGVISSDGSPLNEGALRLYVSDSTSREAYQIRNASSPRAR